MSRPDQDPETEQPELPPPDGKRREFLVHLGRMTFLTAAVTKLGVMPGAQQIDIGNGRKEIDEFDSSCGKKSPGGEGSVSPDLDCGKEKSDGDSDCGKTAPSGNVWSDDDCPAGGGDGADNDCGKSSVGGWAWGDNDCAVGGEDQDCGKTDPLGEPHGDSDGS